MLRPRRTYLPWGILGLPVFVLLLLWDRLPDAVVIHSAGADKWVSRYDWGGVVVSVTAVVALLAYGLLQLQLSFQPMAPARVRNAYLLIAGGAAMIGLLLVVAGLRSQ